MARQNNRDMKREELLGYYLEKSVCGWWVVDAYDPERSWLISTKAKAIDFICTVLN